MTCPKCFVFFSYDETQGPAQCPSCDKPKAAASDGNWFYIRDNKKEGPVQRAEVERLARSGQLKRSDMVMPGSASKWTPAAEIEGLFPAQAEPIAVAVPARNSSSEASEAVAIPSAIPIITYFYAQQGLKIGPVSDDQLKELARMGRLKPNDMVLEQGTTKWSPAQSYDWLSFGKKAHADKQEPKPAPKEEPPKRVDEPKPAEPAAKTEPTPEPRPETPKPEAPAEPKVETPPVPAEPPKVEKPAEPPKMEKTPAPPRVETPAPAPEPPKVEAPPPTPKVETPPTPPPQPKVETPPAPPPAPPKAEAPPAPKEEKPAPPPSAPKAEPPAAPAPAAKVETPPTPPKAEPASPAKAEPAPATAKAAPVEEEPEEHVEFAPGEREQMIERFEHAWLTGKRPELDSYLPPSRSLRRQLIAAMARIDLRSRLRGGEARRVESYLEAHPVLNQEREGLLELIETEFRARLDADEEVKADEYFERFPEIKSSIARRLVPGHVESEEEARRESALPLIPEHEVVEEIERRDYRAFFKAKQLKPEREIELILFDAAAPDDAVERVRGAARLNHPHVLSFFETGSHDNRAFFARESVRARETLAQRVAKTPLPPREAAELLEWLAEAMHQAHKQGVVHRGLNPSRVLFAPAATVTTPDKEAALVAKLTGFDEPVPGGEEPGVAGYLAPEQCNGRTNTGSAAVDVHALGGLLYFMLTGKPPYAAGTVADTLEQVRRQAPATPSSIRSETPADLEMICLRCLEKSPERRYASAQEIGNDLRRFLAGKPVAARPESKWDQVSRWIAQNPAQAAYSALGVCAFLLLIVFVQWLRTDSDLKDSRKQEQVEGTEIAELRASKTTLEAAVAAQAEFLKQGAGDPELGPRLALLYLAQGKLDDYRRVCAGLLKQLGKSADPETTYAIAWASVLGPQANPTPGRIDELSEQLLARHPMHPPRFLVLRGAALFRAGRYQTAAKTLEMALAAEPHPPAPAWLFLAMTQHELGDDDKAKEFLTLADNWLKQAKQPGQAGSPSSWDALPWTEKLIVEVLRQEAGEILK